MTHNLCFKSFYISIINIAFLLSASPEMLARDTSHKEPLNTQTTAIMDAIFVPVSELLPLSLSEKGFEDSKNREQIIKYLESLKTNASKLQEHGRDAPQAFQYMSRSLARDAQEILYWYKQKHYSEARFLLHNLTENCITCHSSYHEKRKFPPAVDFFKKVKVEALPPLKQAKIYVLSRQFDLAIQAYEQALLDRSQSPNILIGSDAFIDYLKLCLRVRQDTKRPLRTIQSLLNRRSLSRYVRHTLISWQLALKQIEQLNLSSTKVDNLTLAKKLINIAQKASNSPYDKGVIPYYVAASGLLLNNLMESPQSEKTAQIAEAYYYLGICESAIGRSFWINQTEYFFETAIRLAAHTPLAKKAYNLLEEYITSEYSGSSGTHIPKDIQERLKELKTLADPHDN